MYLQDKLNAFTDELIQSGAIPQDIVDALFKATTALIQKSRARP